MLLRVQNVGPVAVEKLAHSGDDAGAVGAGDEEAGGVGVGHLGLSIPPRVQGGSGLYTFTFRAGLEAPLKRFYNPLMRYYDEPVVRPEKEDVAGFLPLVMTTPAYMGSIICWFVLVWLTVLDLDGARVALPPAETLLTYTYPVTVLSAVGTGWLGFFMNRPGRVRIALCAPPLHALLVALALLTGLN